MTSANRWSDPDKTAARRNRRTETLRVIAGKGKPLTCFMCGEKRIYALHAKQGHHIAGRANDGTLTGIICLNCHADVTEAMRADGIPLSYPSGSPSPVEALAALLASLGSLLVEIGKRLSQWAEWLLELLEVMDGDELWVHTMSTISNPTTTGR